MLGQAVPEAGPAVVVSFVLAGIAAGLAAICYAELASPVPVSGSTWSDTMAAIPWERGELLALGSSSMGALARVFLGTRATKLIRHAPVPVLVLPTDETHVS